MAIKKKCFYCNNTINKKCIVEGEHVFCSDVCRNRYHVMSLFKWRCALNPSHAASTIHEIVPRSLRPKDWSDEDNMIPLCWICHDKVHRDGAKKYREILLEKLKNAQKR